MRPTVGLRPWLAFLRRARSRFLRLRFDMGARVAADWSVRSRGPVVGCQRLQRASRSSAVRVLMMRSGSIPSSAARSQP